MLYVVSVVVGLGGWWCIDLYACVCGVCMHMDGPVGLVDRDAAVVEEILEDEGRAVLMDVGWVGLGWIGLVWVGLSRIVASDASMQRRTHLRTHNPNIQPQDTRTHSAMAA